MVHFHYKACLRFLALQPFPSLVTSSRCANRANVLLGWVHLENTFAELLPVPMCICTPHRSAEIKSFRFLKNVQLIRHLLHKKTASSRSRSLMRCFQMCKNCVWEHYSITTINRRLQLPAKTASPLRKASTSKQAMAIEWTVSFQAQF